MIDSDNVYQYVEEAAKKCGDNIALIYENKSITYKQLLEKASCLANKILQQAPNEPFIGTSTTRSIDTIVGVIAILKAGKAYLPLDPKYPSLRLQHLVEDANLKFILCLKEQVDFFKELGLSPIANDQQYQVPDIEVINYSPVVCVLYTSGSTGKPKGVCLGHKGLINQLNWQKSHSLAGPGVRTLQFSHLSFDGAFLEIFVPLVTGGTLYLIHDSYRYVAGNLLQFIIDNKINRLFLAYAIVQYLAETAQLYNSYPTSVTEIITGGELLRITPQIAHFFDVMKDCVLMNVYGPTETSVWVTELKLKGNALSWPAIPPIGSLVAGAGIFLVDENMKLVKENETGEILIYGECVGLYYLNKPELTAERFITWDHPLLGAIRVYKTGDMASLNKDSTYQFQGRRDAQVKIRGGYRVELAEIEVVIGSIKGVSQVKVMVREDIPGQKKIAAYIIAIDKSITDEVIRKAVTAQLPAYMVPDTYQMLNQFPLTVSGKIDTLSLPVPEKSLIVDASTFRMPKTELEQYLKSLWENLLQLKNISINDDFFELGGYSLMAIQMMIKIEKDRGIKLPLVSVFDYPSIEKLAKLIDGFTSPVEFSPLVAIKPSGSKPPVYLVHGDSNNVMNFVPLSKNINPDQPVYGLQPKGIDGNNEPLGTLEEIAAFYLAAIFRQNPTGPFAIIGYSFGGYVAFEMAKQLKKAGKPLLMLGLIDTHVLNDFFKDNKLKRKLLRQVPKFKWIAKSFIAHPQKTLEYQVNSLEMRIRHLFKITQKHAPGTESHYDLMNKINQVHHDAISKYDLEKYNGKIVLFKGIDNPYFIDDPEYLGWRSFATSVELYEIPGDHATMLTEPNCKILVASIEKALSLVQNK